MSERSTSSAEEAYYDRLYIEHFSRGEDVSMESLREKYPFQDDEVKMVAHAQSIEIKINLQDSK